MTGNKFQDAVKNTLKEKSILFLYLCLTVITVITHLYMVDIPCENKQLEFHNEVISNTAPSPIQYRVLPYYISEFLQKLGISFQAAYAIIRGFFTFFSVVLLHFFMKKWFDIKSVFAGILFIFSILPLTYIGYDMQPGCMPNLLFFIIGFWIIRERKDYWLMPLLFISIWNRETIVLLILVYFFYRYDELQPVHLFFRTGLFTFCFYLTFLLIRKHFGPHELYGPTDWVEQNFTNYKTYLYALLLFGFMAWWGLSDLKNKPKFLLKSLLVIPFFFVIHGSIGYLNETRYYYPLLPIIIPLGLHGIFGYKKGYTEADTMKVRNVLTKYFKYFYILMLILFIGLFKMYYDKNYSSYIKLYGLAKKHYYYKKLINKGDITRSRQIFDSISNDDPATENFQYSLGVDYMYVFKDYKKALHHFKRYKELFPHGKEIVSVDKHLNMLQKY